jgi:predicted RNase H-like HicB family nuclease
MDAKYTAVFEHRGDWWIGYTEELPGANSQERSLEEARESLREAVQLILEVNRDIALERSEGRDVVREELLVPV